MTLPPAARPRPPAAGAAPPEAVESLSDERDAWLRRLLAAEEAAYRDGYARGRADERTAADRAWAARPAEPVHDGLALAEIEALRWELRGEQRTRETFGRPHPADYQGQENAA